jgi:hypothetical protein
VEDDGNGDSVTATTTIYVLDAGTAIDAVVDGIDHREDALPPLPPRPSAALGALWLAVMHLERAERGCAGDRGLEGPVPSASHFFR